jgi:hypothetical protein
VTAKRVSSARNRPSAIGGPGKQIAAETGVSPATAATREAFEPAGFRTLVWQDDTEASKAWIARLRMSEPPPSPNLGARV